MRPLETGLTCSRDVKVRLEVTQLQATLKLTVCGVVKRERRDADYHWATVMSLKARSHQRLNSTSDNNAPAT